MDLFDASTQWVLHKFKRVTLTQKHRQKNQSRIYHVLAAGAAVQMLFVCVLTFIDRSMVSAATTPCYAWPCVPDMDVVHIQLLSVCLT